MAEKTELNDNATETVISMPTAQPVPVATAVEDEAAPETQEQEMSSKSNVDANGLQTGEWNSGIFDCFDSCIPNCLMSCFCPCVSVAQIAARVGFSSYTTVLVGFGIIEIGLLWTTANADRDSKGIDLLQFALSVTAFVFLTCLRGRIRNTFQIEGSACGDCCTVCCCQSCAIAQMATHVSSYDAGVMSFGPKETLPGYTEGDNPV